MTGLTLTQKKLFRKGMLVVRQENKKYSGNYQDFKREQTINRDAANTKNGNNCI